ncbi:MAG: ribulose-phosphate 3-epimerase, partial [Terriglobales bacterium]
RTLHLIKSRGLRAGVVINPATPIGAITEVLDFVDFVLVMSVNPGFGGQKFIPGTLEKVRKLAAVRTAVGNNFKIEIDGGVDENTVTGIVRAGADVLVAGNAIFGLGDPRLNTERLLKAAQEATLARV